MKLYIQLNEAGSGELSIPVDSTAAVDAVAGKIVAARYRGENRGGFIIENIKETDASSKENAGRWKALSGRGVMSILDEAVIWDYDPLIGMDDVEQIRHFTARSKGDIMATIVTEAKSRGCYPNLSLQFSTTIDSNGDAWTDSMDLDIKAGTTHLEVMRILAALGLDFEMKHDDALGTLDLYAYQSGLGSDVSDAVHFRIGYNCLAVDNSERSADIRNAFLVSIPNPTYPWSIQSDAASIAAYRRREHFLSAGDAPTASAGTVFGTAELNRLKDPKHAIALKVSDAVGSQVFIDYNVGDWVNYDNGTGTEVKYRIIGLQLEWNDSWYADVVVELNDSFTETQIKTALDTRKQGGSSSGSPLKSRQSSAQASFNQIAVHEADVASHGGTPRSTALSDFLTGNGAGVWVKKTLAEAKTILGLSAFGNVFGPATNTDNNIPQWNGTDSKTLKNGLGLSTVLGSPGVDTKVTSEKAVRDALDLIGSVTGGDAHDHVGGDGAQIAYSSLSGTPTIPVKATGAEINTGTDDNKFTTPLAITNSKLVSGPTAAPTDGHLALFDGVTGKLIKDGGAPTIYVHPNHSGEVTSSGDGAQTITNDAITNAKLANMATGTYKGRKTSGSGDPEDINVVTSFRSEVFTRFVSPMLEALTWAAAQIYQAAITFQSTISQAVTSSGAGSTFNQSGTGDIAAFQDAGVSTVRVLDQGGIALVPQAGGFQSVAGLLGYDSVKKRLVLYHETHNYPVPIDPRNTCRNNIFTTTY